MEVEADAEAQIDLLLCAVNTVTVNITVPPRAAVRPNK